MSTDNTHINGDASGPTPDESIAKQIMQDPAAAAGAPAAPVLTSPHIADPGVANLLNQLPGLVGAIDQAIKETAGKPFGFMLMVFTPGIALHATNAQPEAVQQAAIELVESWKAGTAHPSPDIGSGGTGTVGGAANDGG